MNFLNSIQSLITEASTNLQVKIFLFQFKEFSKMILSFLYFLNGILILQIICWYSRLYLWLYRTKRGCTYGCTEQSAVVPTVVQNKVRHKTQISFRVRPKTFLQGLNIFVSSDIINHFNVIKNFNYGYFTVFQLVVVNKSKNKKKTKN